MKQERMQKMQKTSRRFLMCSLLRMGFVIVGLFLCSMAFSQTAGEKIRVSGRITGIEGEELIGASVSEKGTSNGTVSDIDGNYSFMVGANSTLVVNYVGYNPQEIPVNGRSTIDIIMSTNSKVLDEVVVTALGIKREKKALGYAMEELKGNALLETREANVTNALAGKIAGLQVIKASGTGASSKIVLRGYNSLTGNNQPLIVVDGVPVNNFTSGGGDMWGESAGGGTDFGNGLSDINPEDIESISVLKGGAAAALYGSRAGNGAILITTKSGHNTESGARGLGIVVTSGLSLQSAFLKPDLQNSFGQGIQGVFDAVERRSWGPAMGTEVTQWNGKKGPLTAYDNVGNFFKTGIAGTENIAIQQTINKTDVYFSMNRLDDKGTTPNISLNKTSFLARVTTDLGGNDRWKLDVKANYINMQGHNRPVNGVNEGNPYYALYLLPRSIDIRDLNPPTDPTTGRELWYNGNQDSQENPWWLTQHRHNSDTRNRLIGHASLSYAFTDWLSAEIKGGTDYYTTNTTSKQDFGAKRYTNGLYSERSVTFQENNFSFLTTAKKDNLFSNLGGFVTFGGNLMSSRENDLMADAHELNIPGIFNINNGKDPSTVNYNSTPKKINSLYGALQLNWDAYLFLDATLRNDWSSTMSKENRSYLYPSVSFSGIVSDMVTKFGGTMPSWFTFAKIRASYAEVGNSLEAFQLYNTYNLGKDPYGNLVAFPNGTLYDNSVIAELVKSKELGAELRFFHNRLGVDFAWYKSNAVNQLLNIPVDPSTGYSSKKVNAGNIQNQGWELMLNGQIIQNKDFNWNATANLSANKSKIVELLPDVTEYSLFSEGARVDAIKIVAMTGGGYGEIYGRKLLRSDAGKVVVDESGLPLFTEKQEYIGNQQPDFMLGFNNHFSYKNFVLDFLLDGRFGGYLYSGTMSLLHQFGVAAETVVNGKREEFVVPNSVVKKADGTYADNTKAVSPENYWNRVTGEVSNLGLPELFTYDATNIRLRHIAIGYQFDKRVLHKTPFKQLGVSISCNNAWMIYSKLPKIDPESVLGTNTNATGVELAANPTSRTFSFNINFGF